MIKPMYPSEFPWKNPHLHVAFEAKPPLRKPGAHHLPGLRQRGRLRGGHGRAAGAATGGAPHRGGATTVASP